MGIGLRHSDAMQNVRNVKLPSAGVIAGVVQTVVFGGGATYGLYNSLFNVEGGHRAIVYNRVMGVKDKVYAEGTHLMIPLFERPITYDVRARSRRPCPRATTASCSTPTHSCSTLRMSGRRTTGRSERVSWLLSKTRRARARGCAAAARRA